MYKNTRVITRGAACAALAVTILYISSVSPSGQAGIVAAASLFTAAAVIEIGYAPGIAVFFVSSAAGMLILPEKTPIILYVAFFGYYPVIKVFLDRRCRRKVTAWIVKLICFNMALAVVWFLFGSLILASPPTVHYAIVALIGSATFVLFDIGLGRLIGFYIERISKNINRR